MIPRYQIRADYDDTTLVVYQAYRPEIAEAAVRAGRFVEPFSRSRMTWIKPSFAWTMHRCGWATKPGQEHVLALRITRGGFEHALAHACLTSFRPDVHGTREAWQEQLRATPVRVQWDPERTLRDRELDHRSIQIGLGSPVVPAFVDTWLVELHDITPLVRSIRARLDAGDDAGAEAMRPSERPCPLNDAFWGESAIGPSVYLGTVVYNSGGSLLGHQDARPGGEIAFRPATTAVLPNEIDQVTNTTNSGTVNARREDPFDAAGDTILPPVATQFRFRMAHSLNGTADYTWNIAEPNGITVISESEDAGGDGSHSFRQWVASEDGSFTWSHTTSTAVVVSSLSLTVDAYRDAILARR